jgi:peptide/nickel transport system substrate-binding protein
VGMTNRLARRRLMALLAVTALAFTACSSGGDDDEATDTTDTTEAAAKNDPNAIIKVGFDLVQQGGTGVWVDPIKTQANGNANDALFYLVYGRFMTATADGELEPELAESVTIVDKNTIDIKLREGATFSDGSPFDAAAVKSGLERSVAANNQEAFQAQFFSLKSVDVVDPMTARLNIPDGTAASWFDTYIATWHTSIVKAGETDFVKPVGAGPMVVESFQDGVSMTLRKNVNFWDVDEIKVAGIDLVQIAYAEPQSGIAAIRAGQIDMVTTEPSQLPALTGAVKAYARTSPDQTVSIHICKKDGPLADARVRRAFNKGIDRDAINEAIFSGTASPATQIWPKGHRLANPDLDDELAYDPEGAKELLAEAGYADGVAIDVYPIPVQGISETSEVMKQQLAEVGITLNLKPGTNYVNDFLKPGRPGIGIFPGSSGGLERLEDWTGTSLGNVCQYQDAEVARLYGALAGVSQGSDEAVDLWHEAAEHVVSEALGGFVLFRSTLAAYSDERIADVVSLQLGQFLMPDPRVTYVKAKG